MGMSRLRLQETSSRRPQEKFFGATYRRISGCHQNFILGRLYDVISRRLEDFSIGRSHDVGKGRRLALYREPHGMSFGDVLGTSSGRKFAEWANTVKN